MKPTWKFILDCKLHFGFIDKMFKIAKEAGYQYFVWNGRVYQINGNIYKDSGWTVNDIA